MINLHVYPSPITNESRIEREVATIERLGIFSAVEVAGVGASDLPEHEVICSSSLVRRFASEAGSHGVWARAGKTASFGRAVYRHYADMDLSVINCHSVAALPTCVALKRATGARLVYDTHELETEASAAVGLRKPAYKIIEKMGIRQVDHTFTVTESIEKWYREAYGLSNIDTVYNYPSQRQVDSNPDRDYFRRLFAIPDTGRIYLYQGVLGEGRGLDVVREAFHRGLVEDGFLVFLGYGSMEHQVRDWARSSERIHFHPAVAPAELGALTAAADVGLAPTDGATCLSYFYSAPNKMFQYWSAGIPVLASELPEHRRFLNRYPAGVLLEESSVAGLVAASAKLGRLDPGVIAAGLAAAQADLRWETYEDLFRSTYRRLAGSKSKEA